MIRRKHAVSVAFFICLCGLATAVFSQQAASSGTGVLIVLSEPVGAGIFLNGKPMGVTPLKIINIPTAAYRLTLRGSGGAPIDTAVTVVEGTIQKISLALPPVTEGSAGKPAVTLVCTLTVTTTPPGATLFVNNRPTGVTPFTNDTLPPGTYHLRLELAEYDAMEGTVELRGGDSHSIEKTMTAKPGTPATTAQPSGTPVKRAVVPSKDRAASLADARAALIPERASKSGSHGGRTARRWIFGTLAAAAGGTGWYFDTRVAAAVDEQKKIMAEYTAATGGFSQYESRYNSAGKTARKKAQVRNILYGAAGGCGLLFLISIPF